MWSQSFPSRARKRAVFPLVPGSFGAAIIPAAEAKKIFATDIDKAGYAVIKVGVFPASGRELDLSPQTSRFAPTRTPFQSEPSILTPSLLLSQSRSARNRPAKKLQSPGTTIIGTNAGVGVGNNSQRYPASSGSNTNRFEQELREKSLPDGKTTGPVAGYPYFPKPSKKTKSVSTPRARPGCSSGKIPVNG